MNFDTADAMDDRYAVQVAVTGVMVLDAVKSQSESTIGSVSRAVPAMYKHCIMSALKALKLAGEIDYDEHAPAPTRIYRRAMKRIERKVVPYNSEPIVHKDTKTYPTMAVSENYFRG